MGANGVDIFFVISGFVMLHTQLIQRRPPYQFLKNRIIRIVPTYWGITLFVILIYLFFPSLFRGMVITPDWVISSFLFFSSIFADKYPILYVGWTLEWEMLFYVIFAFGLFFSSWRFQSGFVVLAISVVCILFGEFIAIEFLLGMLVAYIYRKFNLGNHKGVVIFLFGCGLLLLSISSKVSTLQLDRVLIWGLPSFFIVWGLLYCPQIKIRLFKYLGDASYSIYLVHVLTIPAFYKFSSRLMYGWNGDILALFCVASSVIFGCVIYSLMEKPATIKIKALWGH